MPKKAKRPTNKVEIRVYFQTQLTKAAHQAATNPGLTPDGRRDALQKLAASYAIVFKDPDLAKQLELIEQEIRKLKEIHSSSGNEKL